MKLGNLLVNSANVNAQSTVLINLSNNATSKRIAVNESVTLGDLGVSSIAKAAAPQFPQSEIMAVGACASYDAQTKATKTKALLDKFEAEQKAYAASGGMGLEDQIVAGVVNWLVKNKGFSLKDTSANVAVIKPADLLVTSVPLSGGQVLFNVTGVATWG